MNSKIKREWVEHLRSGDYVQGRLKLRDYHDRFCCLGVLCNIHAIHHPGIAQVENNSIEYIGNDANLPNTVRYWAEIDQTSIGILVTMNDSDRLSFAAIADWIDTNL